MQQKIVFTGGPSAGKTTLLQALAKEFSQKIAIVPETATILYKGGFHRSNDKISRTFIQKAIFYVQRESENLVCYQNKTKDIICDRGTLDGLAYWPNEESEFFETLQTSKKEQLSRYHWVIHLNTACERGYDLSNPIRTESPEEAMVINDRLKKIWREHPQFLIIPAHTDFFRKLRLAQSVTEQILKRRSYKEIYDCYGRFLEKS